MKTKEEILEKYYSNYKKRIFYNENVLKAMEEYASQQCQKRDEIIKVQDDYIKKDDKERRA